MLEAKWIWKRQASYKTYNQTALFRKEFHLETEPIQARLSITADSWYRLTVNGEWVNDGPCRSWPEHFQFDEMDLAPYLMKGDNELQIIAKYWGTGTFHSVPQQAGFLAQLELEFTSGEKRMLATDETWQAASLPAWIANTPKVSIQMEPQEYYDARLESDPVFEQAVVLYTVERGPWQDLHPRDVPLLTRIPIQPHSIQAAAWVPQPQGWHFCLPAAQLVYPEVVEANMNALLPGGLASLLKLAQPAEVHFETGGVTVFIDGKNTIDGSCHLEAGEHLLLIFITQTMGHSKEKDFHITLPQGVELRLENPVDPANANPWCWLDLSEYAYRTDDLHCPFNSLPQAVVARIENYLQIVETLGSQVNTPETFLVELGGKARSISLQALFASDTHWRFTHLTNLPGKADLEKDSTGSLVIRPQPGQDFVLAYDLGEQDIGYYDFTLQAEAGVELDIYGVEYITPEGLIQHTGGNRNGLTYVTRQGSNHFTSTKRRSGRYIFLTFRNFHSPLSLQNFQLIESTYPVNPTGSFHCSDERLEKIWEISAHTLKLCMEDTFTDCPLYEQTLWVGDARNESVFAYPAFGAADISARCIRLAGQSLERYHIAGCQVPSAWDVLLPAWSFLWGISVWDYYFYTGDIDFLRSTWPWVLENLQGAEKLCTDQGLFSGPFWNMFDWSGIDDQHNTVLHNSMLLVGAIEAAQKCAQVLGVTSQLKWYSDFRRRLSLSLNQLWDPERGAYPDSLLEDGCSSPSTSQHTSFLGLLFNIVEDANRQKALENVLDPPENMVRLGSPFAIQYLYEMLEKLGMQGAVLKSIYSSYLPMLEAGATTVWEVFPSSGSRPGGFPTRSHCHAWSSAPLYFLPRVVLGLRQVEAGGKNFEFSPRIEAFEWAEATIATVHGPLCASWHKEGHALHCKAQAPEGVSVRFVENETLEGYKIDYVD
jgi:alpha-L-rhamnosidase